MPTACPFTLELVGRRTVISHGYESFGLDSAMGWQLVSVPYWEWDGAVRSQPWAEQGEAAVQYLRTKIDHAAALEPT
jgi:hypothetical protein